MAITYNALQDLEYIYQDDGGVFGANEAANTAFDYFPDDAQVDDALYFGHMSQFDDIQVRIGTAFACTSVTFVWEYYDENGAWVTLTVVDGTTNWTALGVQTVTFIPPMDWRDTTVNALDKMWIRCRIDAVNATTEGGANVTDKCQCGDNKAIITGYSSATRCNVVDLYNADVAGGWGVVLRQGISQFYLNLHIDFGDGVIATYYRDRAVQLCIGFFNPVGAFGAAYAVWLVKANAKVEFGKALVAAKTGEHGMAITGENKLGYTVQAEAGSEMSFYGCALMVAEIASHTVYFYRIVDSNFWGCAVTANISQVDNCDFYDTTLLYTGYGPSTGAGPDNTYELLTGATQAWFAASEGDYTGIVVYPGWGLSFSYWNDSHFINCWSSTWLCRFFANPLPVLVYRQYTFDLHVQDTSGAASVGASVAIVDIFGNPIAGSPFVTDGSGDIAQQTVTYRTYERVAATAGNTDTETTYSPHTVTISLAGYITKTIIYTIDRKHEEVEVLLKKSMKKTIEGELLMEINSVGDLLRIEA